ncbi:MAG: 5-deoxy-glucuronate isomerase [Treponema sp.]|nr:5-deoxy-glucuronate isomerase [Treponema sp.]
MQRKSFFNAAEINAVDEWALNSENSNLTAMKLRKFKLKKGNKREFVMNSSEAIIVVVGGELKVELSGGEPATSGLDGQNVAERFDAVYLTNDDACTITALTASDVLICEAAAETSYNSVLIKRKDVTPVESGSGCHVRHVWNMVSPNGIKAERLILGYCESIVDGGWTGWPPHEHGGNLEEIYYYYDISGPVPGVLQFNSNNLRDHVETELAKSGDIFAINEGFHPIVAFPGTKMKNLWFMAAIRPEDRDFGVIRADSAF